MKILFHTIALNRCDLLRQAIESIDTQYDWDLLLHFVSKDPEITDYLGSERLAPDAKSEFIYNIGYNIGVAYCFNEALYHGYEKNDYNYVFLINSDVRFHPGDIDRMISLAEEAPGKALITVRGPHGKLGDDWEHSHGLAACILMPGAFREVGYFDENIFPAYLEDCDYFYRVWLARNNGLINKNPSLQDVNNPLVACLLTGRTHHEGSSVISADRRMYKLNLYFHNRNNKYYISKWGGINDHEKYQIPFKDVNVLRINNKVRTHPYGRTFDRSHERKFYLIFSKNRGFFQLMMLKGYNIFSRY
ncbi:MAG: hypothetical protein KAT09_00805 [Candidatus Aegiribacteria sp.]|nr:hypothetical protein [Candidatus Aegiribacteria sp.]